MTFHLLLKSCCVISYSYVVCCMLFVTDIVKPGQIKTQLSLTSMIIISIINEKNNKSSYLAFLAYLFLQITWNLKFELPSLERHEMCAPSSWTHQRFRYTESWKRVTLSGLLTGRRFGTIWHTIWSCCRSRENTAAEWRESLSSSLSIQCWVSYSKLVTVTITILLLLLLL